MFPTPRIDKILECLQGLGVYSAFDFPEAFLQIPAHPEDRHKTAPHTSTHKLEFACIPFDLVNAAAKLQRQVIHHFSKLITEEWMGDEADPERTEAIQRWPLLFYTPTEVNKFLGLASCYRNFIPRCASTAVPLTDPKKGK
ncbi:uncharacterized protein EMH_0086790 [Eimeria mitis]|uniref:Reverse transcriptase domain-containing protein n=1 Tax=Eimeria mitis TaxID=44415 RepID=U6JVB6_9EIME|nr:uncharacterized protein EMH_0086790 [Eimeria mitis]CDJ27458.1 hypothetical protein EMH_0086790 [Eimeria mitis]